jgi:hypothetical protein
MLPRQTSSALAGNGDVFPATGMVAALSRLGNRAGDFIRVDAPVGRGLGEIPRPAIGQRGMGAAFVAPGEALVDAVAVRLVGNNENTAVGRCDGGGKREHTGQKRGEGSHAAPMNEKMAFIR